MNYNSENNNSKKKGAKEKSPTKYKPKKRLKSHGFVAWPENKSSTTGQSAAVEIAQGRTEDGGFIAYPENKSWSLLKKKSSDKDTR